MVIKPVELKHGFVEEFTEKKKKSEYTNVGYPIPSYNRKFVNWKAVIL